jgi:hypothetical protein
VARDRAALDRPVDPSVNRSRRSEGPRLGLWANGSFTRSVLTSFRGIRNRRAGRGGKACRAAALPQEAASGVAGEVRDLRVENRDGGPPRASGEGEKSREMLPS